MAPLCFAGAREGVSSTEVCRFLAVLGWTSVTTHLVQTTASVKAVRELRLNVYMTSLELVVKQKPG